MNEAVAHAVKTGYDVIAENIRQGRVAASRFREGDYNVREVPGDVGAMAANLIRLARELSTTTIDVCERLLKEAAAARPPEGRTAPVPPFREDPGPMPPPKRPPAPPAAASQMKLTTRFTGGAKARTLTHALARPKHPTLPGDISATPLAPRSAEGKPLKSVSFQSDMSVEGLVALVKIPKGHAPGIYSGIVHAKDDKVPLGILTIEVMG